MSNSVTLPAELTIQTVSQEIGSLKENISNSSGAVTLDASALNSVDTAGIQLLFSLVKELQGKGCQVNWQSTPPILIDTANVLGAKSALSL